MLKKIKFLFTLALVVRLLLAFGTYHSDAAVFPFAGRVIFTGHAGDFYDYLWDLPDNAPELKIYPRNLFNYPPVTYFSLGTVSGILTAPLGGFVDEFIYNLEDTFGDIRLNILLLVIKLPLLAFDLGTLYFLLKMFEKESQKKAVYILWLFNPVNLYATYMMGMYEIIPVFFVVASLYFAKKRGKLASALMLGLGASFKIFPLMFLVPLSATTSDWRERLKIFAAGFGVYIISILPFLGSTGFRQTALVAGQTMKSLYLTLPISGGEAIIPYLALYIFFSLAFLINKGNAQVLWKRYFYILLLFFMLTHYHPQWFLWITPFFIYDFVYSKYKNWLVLAIALFSYFGLITLFDPGLSTRLFAPIFPHLYEAPGLWELLGIRFDLNFARSVLHTLFVGAALYWFVYYKSSLYSKPKS